MPPAAIARLNEVTDLIVSRFEDPSRSGHGIAAAWWSARCSPGRPPTTRA